jgi:hypothetical protein
MKLFCPYSGTHLTLAEFPELRARIRHPIFELPLQQLEDLRASTNSDSEHYLLVLAFLNSSTLVEFRTPAKFSTLSVQNAITHLEPLAWAARTVLEFPKPSEAFPRLVIDESTADLSTLGTWLGLLKDSFAELSRAARVKSETKVLETLEEYLDRVPASPSKLADWAAIVGKFPKDKLPEWKSLIRKAVEGSLKESPEELIRFCELQIPIDSVYAIDLMKHLRGVEDSVLEGFGCGWQKPVAAGVRYQILEPRERNERSESGPGPGTVLGSSPGTLGVASSVPTVPEPKKSQFPTLLAYMKAKTAWDSAQRACKTIGQAK